MKNKYLYLNLFFIVSLLFGLKLYTPPSVIAVYCDADTFCPPALTSSENCVGGSATCVNNNCEYSWECNYTCNNWGSWGACSGGYQTRFCLTGYYSIYQIQRCGAGGGGGGPERQGEVNCPGGTVVDYNQPISTVCSSEEQGYFVGNAQRITGCCREVTTKGTCEWLCEWKRGREVCRKECTDDYTACAQNYYTTYACVPTCDANAWGAWGACSATCGGGIQTRTNACGSTQGQVCNTQSCQGPWWQVKDGDITTNGDISSKIPSGYYLNTIGSGGFPGVPVYGGQIGVTPGTISQTLWNANTTTVQSRIFNYSYFKNLIPDTIVFNDINKLPNGSGVTVDANGYEWYKIIGNLDTVGNIDFGSRKVILFVEAGNLNIGGNINLTDGVGFFVVFVNGRINIAGTTTSLEGIYESDGNITTGVGTSQLLVRGSVATYGSITMQRDLADDTTAPAELFEFAPDQIVLFPKQLQFKRAKWAEVAP